MTRVVLCTVPVEPVLLRKIQDNEFDLPYKVLSNHYDSEKEILHLELKLFNTSSYFAQSVQDCLNMTDLFNLLKQLGYKDEIR